MNLSIVLVLALNLFAVQSYRCGQSNHYHAEDESVELDEQDDPSLVSRCGCLHLYSCPYEHRDLTVSCKHIGPLYVHCCISVLESEKPIANGEWLSHSQQNPSQRTTQMPTRITTSQPITQDPSLMTSQKIIFTTQATPPQPGVQTQSSAQIPTKNLTSEPKPQREILTSAQTPITSTSPQPQLPSPSEVSPLSNVECVCTPFFGCYDEETSSNLTNVVDDRSIIPLCEASKPKKTCPDPTDVCCCNRDKPSQQPHQPRPSQISPPNCEGNCIPINDCNGEYVSNRNSNQGTCIDPHNICCHKLVMPVSPITSVTSLNTSTLSPPSHPQPSSPSESSLSANTSECICTPFYLCYDPETSSNLTGLVHDRNFQSTIPETSSIPTGLVNDRNIQCLDSEVCCHNLTPPSGVTETTGDCSGLCIHINDCPGLSRTLNDAQNGSPEAIQKLRSSVCSKANGILNVCCS